MCDNVCAFIFFVLICLDDKCFLIVFKGRVFFVLLFFFYDYIYIYIHLLKRHYSKMFCCIHHTFVVFDELCVVSSNGILRRIPSTEAR